MAKISTVCNYKATKPGVKLWLAYWRGPIISAGWIRPSWHLSQAPFLFMCWGESLPGKHPHKGTLKILFIKLSICYLKHRIQKDLTSQYQVNHICIYEDYNYCIYIKLINLLIATSLIIQNSFNFKNKRLLSFGIMFSAWKIVFFYTKYFFKNIFSAGCMPQ